MGHQHTGKRLNTLSVKVLDVFYFNRKKKEERKTLSFFHYIYSFIPVRN